MKDTAIDKAVSTISSIKKELDEMPSYDARKLNEVEARIRVELQVMESLVNHLGREVYANVQTRRQQLRTENQQWIKDVTSPVEDRLKEVLGKEDDGDRNIGANRDTGVGIGTDQPSGSEPEGDSKASRPARRARRKKSA